MFDFVKLDGCDINFVEILMLFSCSDLLLHGTHDIQIIRIAQFISDNHSSDAAVPNIMKNICFGHSKTYSSTLNIYTLLKSKIK